MIWILTYGELYKHICFYKMKTENPKTKNENKIVFFYSLPMFVDRCRSHAERDRAVHIRHHAGGRSHTYGRWLRGVQTFQNQESPIRHHGINGSCGHRRCRHAEKTKIIKINKKTRNYRVIVFIIIIFIRY